MVSVDGGQTADRVRRLQGAPQRQLKSITSQCIKGRLCFCWGVFDTDACVCVFVDRNKEGLRAKRWTNVLKVKLNPVWDRDAEKSLEELI